jgi:hypothetical protein
MHLMQKYSFGSELLIQNCQLINICDFGNGERLKIKV